MPRHFIKASLAPILLGLSLVAPQVHAQSAFYLWGEEGEPISWGQEHAGTDSVGDFTGLKSFHNGVLIRYDDATADGRWWNFDFADRDAVELRPGVYRDAIRYPFNDGAHGLDISGNGIGCNTLFGHFTVLAVSYGPKDSIQSFAAEFEQDCGGGDPGPWLYGWVRYNSNLPPDYNNVVEDGGFEEGEIVSAFARAPAATNNWSSDTWTIWDADSHLGMYSAVTTVGGSLEREFDPTPVEYVDRISFWAKQVPASFIAVDLMYADGTFDQFPLFDMRTVWTPFRLTEFLRQEGELSGVRFYGATSSSDQITTMLDDVYIRSSFVMEDGFESGDFSGWDSAVGVP